MSPLARLQAEFRAFLQQAPVVPPAPDMRDPPDVVAPEALRVRVRDTERAGRDVLLGVYREAYTLRLMEALLTDYPGLHAMAGPGDFDTLARAYIAARPSRHPSVRWFGRGLADFLATTPPFDRTPAAADMARFEWALGEAFDAADAMPLGFEDMAALPADAWAMLRLVFVPSLRRLTLQYAVPQAWQRRDTVEPGTLEVPREVPGAVDWLIWRTAPDAQTQFRSMARDEAWMLDRAREGVVFPALCEGLVGFAPPGASDEASAWAATRAAGLLRTWLDAGCLCAVHEQQ